MVRPCEVQCVRCEGCMIGSQPSMRMMHASGGVCFFCSASCTFCQCVLRSFFVLIIFILSWSSSAW